MPWQLKTCERREGSARGGARRPGKPRKHTRAPPTVPTLPSPTNSQARKLKTIRREELSVKQTAFQLDRLLRPLVALPKTATSAYPTETRENHGGPNNPKLSTYHPASSLATQHCTVESLQDGKCFTHDSLRSRSQDIRNNS